jgi:hypothetical protein
MSSQLSIFRPKTRTIALVIGFFNGGEPVLIVLGLAVLGVTGREHFPATALTPRCWRRWPRGREAAVAAVAGVAVEFVIVAIFGAPRQPALC